MEKNKKVELLAPAGDFSCFMAAINAGADAVYLGGEKFGARAYANNFTCEEIIEAIKVAHLFSKKVYLTVNTLVKEKEMPELVPFMEPLYLAGLDGVIIQDVGVVQTLKENFPGLELHASTQMTITGKYGAKLLKEMGICRVVPARELSFQEMKDIKEETGLEIEAFIHGAMCYGYSGQCLFSSILGGRSGNRGRCAGPCRLPYETADQKQIYPLSLKDMYTLPLIPELIETGIDSFKIEGRMKSPEYVAGVTSMYRKYIDRYLENPKADFTVDKKDEAVLRKLYIRSDLCEGYYKKHNGKDMVTLKEPGYLGCDDTILNSIREKYLNHKPALPIRGKVTIEKGKPCTFTLAYHDQEITMYGEIAQEASNRPLSDEDIEKRMSKMGDTYFILSDLQIYNDQKSFLPVKSLNDLRRNACKALEALFVLQRNDKLKDVEEKNHVQKQLIKNETIKKATALRIMVSTLKQLECALKYHNFDAIYVSSDLLLTEDSTKILLLIKENQNFDYYISFPHILRKKSYPYLQALSEFLDKSVFKGALIRNLETLQWLVEQKYQGEYVADSSVYCWNDMAWTVWSKYFDRLTESVELNKKELLQLGRQNEKELILYTKLPLMLSANCIQKTLKGCINDKSGKQNVFPIIDRYHNEFSIEQNCFHCYNILYNTVPLSLHGQWETIQKEPYAGYRLDFSIETVEEMKKILDYYDCLVFGNQKMEFPLKDYTNGHYKRGVE